MNYGDFPLEETIHVLFTSRAFATGIPGTLSAATVAVYEDITSTPIQTSVAVTESLNSIAGLNAVPIVATAGNGYELGKNYHIVIEAGTVGGVSVVGEIVAYFSIGRSAAAVDLANATDGLGAIKDETTLIVADTGTDGVVLAANAITEAKIADNAIATEHIATGAISADSLAADTITAAKVAADVHAEAADAVWDEALSGHTTVGSTAKAVADIETDATAILGDTNELQLDDVPGLIATVTTDLDDIKGTSFIKDTHSLIDIETYVDILDDATSGNAKIATDVAATLVDTAVIGAAGAGLTDLGGMATAMKAEILVEANAALDTAISELGVAAPAITPTVRTALMLMYMALRNKLVVQTSGTDALEIHNDAGTKITQKLLTDDGSDYTEAKAG